MVPMNWKATVVWSGATALATWMASSPAVVAPGESAGPAQRGSGAAAAIGAPVVDLTAEADRLARRLGDHQAYAAPARDPFRFEGAAPEVAVAAASPVDSAVVPEPVVPPVAEPPPYTLVGMAEDRVGEELVRTAVISGTGDLWLVRAGETVDGRFSVTAVEAGAVELVRADTGATVRLAFRP